MVQKKMLKFCVNVDLDGLFSFQILQTNQNYILFITKSLINKI